MHMPSKKAHKVPIDDICHLLNIPLKRRGRSMRGRCPIRNHPDPKAFVIDTKLNRYWCWGHCQSGGSGLELYARVKHLTLFEAARELHRILRKPPEHPRPFDAVGALAGLSQRQSMHVYQLNDSGVTFPKL